MSRVHHVALRTHDVTGLSVFYRALAGLEVVRDALPRAVWLGLGPGAVLMIERAEADEPRPTAGGMDFLAFAVSVEAWQRLRSELSARDVLEAQTDHTLYLRDPDGRRVGVSCYPL
jgi:catechol-2,3-dioxygenase